MIYWYLQDILSYPSNRLSGSMIATFKIEKVQSENLQAKMSVELSTVFADATDAIAYRNINSLLISKGGSFVSNCR